MLKQKYYIKPSIQNPGFYLESGELYFDNNTQNIVLYIGYDILWNALYEHKFLIGKNIDPIIGDKLINERFSLWEK